MDGMGPLPALDGYDYGWGYAGSAGVSFAGMGHNGGPSLYDGMLNQPGAGGMPFTDAEQVVWPFFVAQASYIEREIYKIKYPDIRYPGLVPVDTSADKWVQTVTYFSQDRTGTADWLAGNAQDVPLVETQRAQFSTNVHMAGIGYGYNEEELAQAARLGINLTTDKAEVARRGAEEFIDRVVLFGDANVGYTGLFNAPGVTVIAAAANGVGGSTLWPNKTPQNILNDVNNTLTGQWITTFTVEMSDTLLLPLASFTYLNTTQLTELSQITILDWLRRNNTYTSETGQPLTIRGIRGLDTAGTNGTGRMIAYRRDPTVLKFHMPMPFEFMAPWRKGPMRYEVPGRFRIGGVDVRRPAAVRYVDGIA